MDLNGAVGLVTGGNGGLGQRICHALAQQGAHIAVTYAQSRDQTGGRRPRPRRPPSDQRRGVRRSGSDDRQPPNADRPVRDRHHRATNQCVFDAWPDALQQRREPGRIKAFFPNAYHGRPALAADRKQGMEIRVKRDADARLGTGARQHIRIRRAAHADFGHMDHVPAGLRQQAGG